MNQKIQQNEAMKLIQHKISDSLEPFINTKNTEQTRRDIVSTLMSTCSEVLQELGGSIHDADFDVVRDENNPDMMNIVPKNFFTFLLLYGIHYPPATCGFTRYVAEKGPYIGTTFTWNEEKKEGAIKPPDMIGR